MVRYIFSILVIPFAFVPFAVDTIAQTLNKRYTTPTIATGVVLALTVGVIVFGGIKRIGHVSKILSPFIGIACIVAGLLVSVLHII